MPDRSRRVRLTLIALAVAALLTAGAAFTYAILQTRHTANALATEIRVHCVTDATTTNRQRTLDLGLIASDRAYLAILHREDKNPASAHDENLIAGQIAWLAEVLTVRLRDLPAYHDPRNC